jgi:predicted methyltransferase
MFRNKVLFLTGMLVVLALPFSQASAAKDIKDVIAAAIANPARPDADRGQDAERKSQQVLEFSGIKPGDHVADFIPGKGYVTRLFSKIVGDDGYVYAIVPAELPDRMAVSVGEIADDPAYGNVSVLRDPVNNFMTPEKLDLVWTSMNYHDLHDEFFGPADLSKVNKAIYDALKPGGIYLVLDHAAEAGSGVRDTDKLHRIDPAVVKKEVEAAGFELAAESDLLKNPDDDHSKKVFDPSIRGKTDKFIFKFRKPMKAD